MSAPLKWGNALGHVGEMILAILFLIQSVRLNFYRSYFYQKQVNKGKDPRKVLREIFPLIWWLL